MELQCVLYRDWILSGSEVALTALLDWYEEVDDWTDGWNRTMCEKFLRAERTEELVEWAREKYPNG